MAPDDEVSSPPRARNILRLALRDATWALLAEARRTLVWPEGLVPTNRHERRLKAKCDRRQR